MIRDDIHDALNRGDKDHASELLMVLRHFLETHPEAQLKRAEVVERLPHASQNSSTKTIWVEDTSRGLTAAAATPRHRIIAAGGTAPTADPARARPRLCAHPLPVSARFTASARPDSRHSTGTGVLAQIAAGAPPSNPCNILHSGPATSFTSTTTRTRNIPIKAETATSSTTKCLRFVRSSPFTDGNPTGHRAKATSDG